MKIKWIQNFLLIIFSLILCMGLTEILLRMTGFVPQVPIPPYLYSADEKSWWTLAPGFVGKMETADGEISYKINSTHH